MYILILVVGLILGKILNMVINKISNKIGENNSSRKIGIAFTPIICAVAFEILYLRMGLTIIFIESIVMTSFLIIFSFIDLWHRIIPDFMVALTFIIGIIFSLLVKNSVLDTIFGIIAGGGILLILSIIPNAMGGGDVKLMFAVGAFLGLNRTLWAMLLAFLLSSIFSIPLILLKVKGTRDYIPFGPFIALGSYLSIAIFV